MWGWWEVGPERPDLPDLAFCASPIKRVLSWGVAGSNLSSMKEWAGGGGSLGSSFLRVEEPHFGMYGRGLDAQGQDQLAAPCLALFVL